jgi:hypothetical protein
MLSGHFAVAMASKKAAPSVSLGTLFLAAQLLDLLWPIFLLLGVEHVRIVPGNPPLTVLDFYDYPITHSALGALGWSLALGAGYFIVRRSRRDAVVVGALVFSHWLLDLPVHLQDLPLWPGGPLVGFGLWRSLAGTLVLEYGLYVAGVAVYASATRARDGVGRWAFGALVVALPLLHIGSLFGPPPPSVSALAWSALAMWLLVPWGYWIDRHREARGRR